MTKSEFVDKVAATSGLSKKDAGTAVDAVISSIEDALKSGEDVTFTGFGKFLLSIGIGVYPKGDVIDLQIERGGRTDVVRGRPLGR